MRMWKEYKWWIVVPAIMVVLVVVVMIVFVESQGYVPIN